MIRMTPTQARQHGVIAPRKRPGRKRQPLPPETVGKPLQDTLTLPWPPTSNHRLMPARGRLILSPASRQYRKDAAAAVLAAHGKLLPLLGRLRVTVTCYGPHNDYDVGNCEKVALDVLTRCRVWQDDQQIDDLRMVRGHTTDNPRLEVVVEEMES